MDDYLSKPFSMEELRAVLIHWLASGALATDDSNSLDFQETEPGTESIVTSDGLQTISAQVLEMISALDPKNGKALANRVIGVYQNNSSELIESIADALEESDGNKIRTSAHALKSSSGNVGAERLVGMCREIEFAAKDNNMKGMLDRLTSVRLEHDKVLSELDRWSRDSA
jgi:HPt (histidine-containing phosphotransfer) domain-containing protein